MYKMLMRSAVLSLAMFSAQTAFATTDEDPIKPVACEAWTASSSSSVLGTWTLRQRDDSAEWTGPWTIVFKADGSWTQNEKAAGYWCQSGDTVVFGFSEDPHTTYRGTVGNKSIQGIEAWNQGGTGVFVASR